MNRPQWMHLVAAALAVAACAGATPAAAATAPAAAADPAAAANGYLEARGAAITAADPAAVLSSWVAPGSRLADGEALLARGAARRAGQLGHAIESVICEADVLDVVEAPDSEAATVTVHAIVTTTWRARSGALDTEASGIDHTLSLQLSGESWQVVADAYTDVMRLSYLEAAGASAASVRHAGRVLERAASAVSLPREAGPMRVVPARRYTAIIKYDRPAAQAYADKYALSYNPTYVRFGADCADFASQCANAGSMPHSGAAYNIGWWYNKKSTSSPSDDTYSLSWINVTKQISFWNASRTDWATSAGALSRGDFIYYDWTGDGFWDHVAFVAGTNSAGQKIVDAHTTDLYHVYWKLGSSNTKYKYAKVRTQWVI